MPEIGEVARIVHFLRKDLVGKTLASVKAQDDSNVFGKAGTSATEFEKAMTGKKVVGAGQQGKYFWLLMSSPPHPVFHFGMTGWLDIRGDETGYYKPKKTAEATEWPPRFWKFVLQTQEEPKIEAAFTDARRFARIRLVDCAAEDIRKTTPLKENGPDPVLDQAILTLGWLTTLMKKKHVPVKALLLDQANISGIGNWVGDEIMYHAKLHPEQYSDTFSDAQLRQLHTSILHICKTAVDLLADSSQFPDEWLFKHRWGKGKKDSPTTLPNGAKITFITVGGRTSCVVPSVQRKTGAVAGDVKGDIEDAKVTNGNADKKTRMRLSDEKLGSKGPAVDNEVSEIEQAKAEVGVAEPKLNGRKRKADSVSTPEKKTKVDGSKASSKVKGSDVSKEEQVGRRRSARTKK
ncbi:MAG: hypothetical protein M1818_006012 [Claussenomyces sp. TS43310]|nr:MAG: hypothetical protein M1818_006012 [Claussenomyces sp. TS43310]